MQTPRRTTAPGKRYRTSRAVQGKCYLESAGPTLVSAARFLTLGRDVSRWGPRYGAGVLFQIYFQGPNCCGTRRDRRDSSGPFAALRRRCALQHGAEIGCLGWGGYHSRGIATCGPASRNPWCRPMSTPPPARLEPLAAPGSRDPWRGGGFVRRRKNTSPLRG